MKEVFVVVRKIAYEGSHILAVFDSKKAAQIYAAHSAKHYEYDQVLIKQMSVYNEALALQMESEKTQEEAHIKDSIDKSLSKASCAMQEALDRAYSRSRAYTLMKKR